MKSRYQVLGVLPVVMLVCGLLPAPAEAQFTQQGPKLVGTDAVNPTMQAYSASISSDGNTVIVGGPEDNTLTGAAWVFTRSDGVWSQQGPKLVGSGAMDLERQGYSVSLSGDGNTAIVGGPFDNYGGTAWVFTRSAGMWSQQAKLVGTGAVGSAAQGASVSLSGDGSTAIVGGYGDNGEVGAAWVFTRSAGVWSQEAKLVVAGASAFGYAVALSGDGNTAIVGEPGADDSGAAWVFARSHGAWTQQAKLVGTEAVGISSQGYSASISSDGNTVIVGGPLDSHDAGAAWVFTRSGGVWTQQGPKLVGTDVIGPLQLQGISVSLSSDGNIAFVGGFGDNNNMGAAWVFTRSAGVWSQEAKLVGTGAVAVPFVEQGTSVSLSADGNTAVVGGPFDDNVAGAAWIFSQPSVFAGAPGKANCHGQSVSALARQYGGLNGAAAALGYADVSALQDAIETFCSRG